MSSLPLFSSSLASDIGLPLLTFAFLTAGTPGPNNMMLTASGARFGWRRTVPHIFGIFCGLAVMIALSGLGLAQLFIVFPACQWLLKLAGGAYLLWLSYKLWTAKAGHSALPFLDRPMRPHEAALFQGVNPKAWMMATTIISLFAVKPEQTLQVTVMAIAVIGVPDHADQDILNRVLDAVATDGLFHVEGEGFYNGSTLILRI